MIMVEQEEKDDTQRKLKTAENECKFNLHDEPNKQVFHEPHRLQTVLDCSFVLACSSEDSEDEAGRAAKGLSLGPARGVAEAEGHEAPEGERVAEAEAGKL